VSLKGGPELRARLRAIKQSFKPIGKNWATDTAAHAKSHVPKKTGRLMRSIRVRNASQKKATVVGHFSANFVDAGTKAHDIRPKKGRTLAFTGAVQGPAFGGGSPGGRTIFSKKVHHPRTRAQPFKRAAAIHGLRKNPMAAEVIHQWNEAAR
jgi:hypothetical protein